MFPPLSHPLLTQRNEPKWVIGCPDSIFVAFSRVAEIRATIDHASDSLPLESVREAETLEMLIRSHRPEIYADADSIASVAHLAALEVWRHAALIHLYRAVYRTGPLHPVVRNALAQILALSKTLELAAPDMLHGTLACPLFLAATVAVAPLDRAACRKRLKDFGPEQVWQANLAVAEETWAETDRTGVPADWLDLVKVGRGEVFFI
jgi:hypothetical protein